MKGFRYIVLALLFCLDVQVKAEKSERVVSAPHAKKTFQGDLTTVILQPGSVLEPRPDRVTHLVKGHFFIESKKSATFQSAFAAATCVSATCMAIVKRTDSHMEIKAVGGKFRVRRLGDKTDYELRSGLQVNIGQVLTDGAAEMEFPQSLPWASTVKEWALFYPGDIKQFRATLSQFRDEWQTAVDSISELHQERAGREIANYNKELAEERARQKIERMEDEKMRQLFRQKNDLDF